MFQASDMNSFIDVQEALERVSTGDVPSTWQVFHTSRKKLRFLISSFCGFIGLVMGFLEIYVSTNFDHHPPAPFAANLAVHIIVVIFVVFTAILSILAWNSVKNVMLIITPEGLVYGDCEKPQKMVAITYQEVAARPLVGSIVVIPLKTGKKRRIDCRYFESSSKEVASGIISAYTDFQRKQREGRRRGGTRNG